MSEQKSSIDKVEIQEEEEDRRKKCVMSNAMGGRRNDGSNTLDHFYRYFRLKKITIRVKVVETKDTFFIASSLI